MKGDYLVSVKDALQLVLEFAMFVVALLALVVQLIVAIMACC
nr:putative holin-like toxin [Furfurilactobacillus milii]